MSNDDQNNMEAALAREVANGTSISAELSPESGPADKTVLIRLTEADRERWKEASETVGKTMSQMIRDYVNKFVEDTLDCPHPTNMRRYYPWSEFCLQCGTRLR
jgi:predicted DNA-binding protein